jgi:hypothetical protein
MDPLFVYASANAGDKNGCVRNQHTVCVAISNISSVESYEAARQTLVSRLRCLDQDTSPTSVDVVTSI